MEEKENLAEELAKSFERWEYLKEHGGSDPFYADGGSMNLVRNHIMYYKNKMVEGWGRVQLPPSHHEQARERVSRENSMKKQLNRTFLRSLQVARSPQQHHLIQFPDPDQIVYKVLFKSKLF